MKHEPSAVRIHEVMDPLTLGALAAAGCVAFGIAQQRGPNGPKRAAAALRAPAIRQIRKRHRRLVRAIVELAGECLERHPDGSYEAFTAREALRAYVPQTIAAYLAVPPALRRVRRAGGPSPDDELSRQLRHLVGGLQRIREADALAGAARMAANAAFLDERFGLPEPGRLAAPAKWIVRELVDTLGTALRRV